MTEKQKALARARNKRYRSSHRERLKAKARERYRTDPDFRQRGREATKRWYSKARQKIISRSKEAARVLRSEVLAAYGGKCACCDETAPEFLHVDHIYGGGGEHRREMNGASIYPWLKRRGFPKDQFRLLCVNCNFSLGHYGYCPHQKKRSEGM